MDDEKGRFGRATSDRQMSQSPKHGGWLILERASAWSGEKKKLIPTAVHNCRPAPKARHSCRPGVTPGSRQFCTVCLRPVNSQAAATAFALSGSASTVAGPASVARNL